MPDIQPVKIQIKRGPETVGGINVVPNAQPGELMITTDTNNLYVGKGSTSDRVLVADSTVPSRVQALENKSNTIFTSNGDDFSDNSKVDFSESLSVVVDSDVLRPTLLAQSQKFSDDESYNDIISSSNVAVQSGNAYQFQGVVGAGDSDTETVVSNSLFSDEFSFGSGTSMSINVIPNFTIPDPLLAHSSMNNLISSSLILFNDAGINKTYRDSSGNVYHAFLSWTTTNISFSVYKNGLELANRIINQNRSSSYAALSDTHIKNLDFTESADFVFIAAPINMYEYNIYKVDKSTNDFTASKAYIGGTHTVQGISILWDGTRLHILMSCVEATNRDVRYASWTTPTDVNFSSINYLIRYTGASEIVYKVKLVHLGGDRVAWASFCRRTSGAVAFGIIDVVSNPTYPHNYRTDAAQTTTAPFWAAGTRLFNATGYLSDSNGCGTMVFDNTNNFCHLVWGSNGNSDTGFGRISTNSTNANPVSNIITTSPFDYFAPRDCEAFLRPTPTENGSRILEVFFQRSSPTINAATRTHLIRASVTINAVGAFSNNNDLNVLVANDSAYLLNSVSLVPRSSTDNFYDIYTQYSTTSYGFIEHNMLSPKLQIELCNFNGSTLSGGNKKDATSGATLSFNVSGVLNSKIVVKFNFIFNILTSDFSGSNRSVFLSGFIVERTGVSGSGVSTFVSKTLVNDKLIKNASLSVTQSLGTESGNGIEWFISSLGDYWVPIGAGSNSNTFGSSNNWVVTFADGYYGSNLRVKANIAKGATATTELTVPRIDSYSVNSINVLTLNDLLPFQVNQLKMGLRLQALTSYTTTSFLKMMVDTFLNTDNIDTLNTTANYNSSSQWYTASADNQVVISKVENTTSDGVTSVTSAIVMAEYSGDVIFEIRRGSGAWLPVILGSIISFSNTSGSPSNEIQLKAIMQNSSTLYGFAYLYQ